MSFENSRDRARHRALEKINAKKEKKEKTRSRRVDGHCRVPPDALIRAWPAIDEALNAGPVSYEQARLLVGDVAAAVMNTAVTFGLVAPIKTGVFVRGEYTFSQQWASINDHRRKCANTGKNQHG